MGYGVRHTELGRRGQRRPVARRRGARTVSSARLANLPLAQVVAILIIAQVSAVGVTWLLIGSTSVLSTIIGYMLAAADRNELARRGHSGLPQPEWALLAPIAYLVLRSRSTHHDSWDGLTAVWMNLGNLAALPVVALIVQLWGGAAQTLGRT
jgi:hypothetical protein